ncbi:MULTISPECIES: MBL fold metallo-hydrolase [unclassified Sedimentibacter]|uniref:MBL fold metallo-hydrolase n=1 Tax=unclassified Sedimentibacter TaxID=2649220 RepID=UPI0027DF6C24|nr:MBL fold metallo-hydrolase [Sedimentibacter sp. MB35-C1]WMJ77067.1 MBL fold metallo-hydrolase [Sedimentibacter sp. MB35-C1]
MKLKVLVDNNTYIDEYFLGEPAVCYYIEDNGTKILFDLGYSDIFIQNAKKMDIDLKLVDTIVFSHGHNDHTRGLRYMADHTDLKDVAVVAHPLCFNSKMYEKDNIGAPFNSEQMKGMCRLKLTSSPLQISDNIVFLGEIPNIYDYEERKKIGMYSNDGEWKDDRLADDSAIVYKNEKGLFIITGCSHSGICNIVEYAKRVCCDTRITGIIGGFHLFDIDEQLLKTIEFFESNKIDNIYPCHCVSFRAKAKLNERIRINEVGVGLTLML